MLASYLIAAILAAEAIAGSLDRAVIAVTLPTGEEVRVVIPAGEESITLWARGLEYRVYRDGMVVAQSDAVDEEGDAR